LAESEGEPRSLALITWQNKLEPSAAQINNQSDVIRAILWIFIEF
jgi:hypothetical protein